MAGKSYIKVGSSNWDRIKKIYIKTGGQTWSAVRKAYVKTDAGFWRKVFDTASNRPFIAGNDIPKIRLNTFRTGSSYNPAGTLDDPVDPLVEAPPVQQMGPSWTSPTYGWPYESLGRHLWGYDGTWTSGNGTSMTFVYTWLYNLTGNSNDNTAELNATSTTGRTDMLTNLSSHLGQSNGDYFDKNFLTFRVTATNSAGNASAESAPVYIVREVPTGSITMVSPAIAATNSTMSATFTYSNNWYNKTNVSNSYIEWFAVDNLGDPLTNSNRVQIDYLSSITVTGTTSKSGTTFHVPTIGNKYYYVRMTLNNSGTENAVIAITGFTPKSSVTSQANKTAKTGTGVTPPTFLTATTNRSDGVNLTFGGSDDAVSYDIFWNTNQTANPSDSASPDFPGESSPFLDTTIGIGVTRWYWVRAKNSSGQTSSWYPVGNGVTGTRTTAYNVSWNGAGGSTGNEGIPWSFTAGSSVTVPSVSRIGYTFLRWTDTSSGDYTYTTTGGTFFPPSQNITMYARWQVNVCTIPPVIGMTEANASNAVNAAGFLYEYTDYIGTTNASIVGTVAAIDPPVGSQPGCGTNITLTIYTYVQPNLTPPSISSVAMGNPGGPVTVYFNGGSGPYYQMWWTTGSAGSSYDASGSSSPITDSTGPGSAGTWYAYVRSVSSPNNTGTGPSTTISAWSPAFAFTVSDPVTCGSCQDYGSATYTGQTTGCAGTYYTVYNNYSIGQRQTCTDGSYQYCANRTYSTVSSSTQIDGQCGYTAPVACVCNYSDLGSYHYSPQCCPSGTQRTGSLSGVTSGACCPNVYKTVRYVCKSFDVTNSSSVNYYDCYSVGQCAAQQNPDGSRATCYI